MKKRMDKKGFSLAEMVVVLAVIGIFISFFYTLFFLNWGACEQLIARADLGQDMDATIDQIELDGRLAHNIVVTSTGNSFQAVFNNSAGTPISTYTMSNNGQLTMTRGGAMQIMTEKLDFNNSNFFTDPNGTAIIVTMAMKDDIFGQPVTLNSQTEIYPRN